MKTKKCWILGAVVVCCVVFLSMKLLGITSEDLEKLRQSRGFSTLCGLKGVQPTVMFVMLGEDQKDKLDLLTQEMLQTQVELALRTAGIEVVPKRTIDTGTLFVFIQVMRMSVDDMEKMGLPKVPFYFFTVATEFLQDTEVARDPKIRSVARTWPTISFPALVYAGSSRVEQGIRDKVTSQINEFCNDYLAANPIEEPGKRDAVLQDMSPRGE